VSADELRAHFAAKRAAKAAADLADREMIAANSRKTSEDILNFFASLKNDDAPVWKGQKP
jgi:hypothetical protein